MNCNCLNQIADEAASHHKQNTKAAHVSVTVDARINIRPWVIERDSYSANKGTLRPSNRWKYDSFKMSFCPVCGTKLEKPTTHLYEESH